MVVSFFYYFGRTPTRTRHETLVKYYNKKEGKQKKAFFNSSPKSAHDLRVRYLANSTSLNKNARMEEDSIERNSIEERNLIIFGFCDHVSCKARSLHKMWYI